MSLIRLFVLSTLIMMGFVIGSFFTYLISIDKSLLFDKSIISGVVSGIGSLIGGLFGGIAAFMIARWQLLKDDLKDNNKQNTVYLNLIRALKNELNHNKEVFKFLCTSDKDPKKPYIDLLESEVWGRIKYDANNFLPPRIFKLLDDQSREFKDLKEGTLPEYSDYEKIDFSIRYDTIKKIILDISRIEKDLQI